MPAACSGENGVTHQSAGADQHGRAGSADEAFDGLVWAHGRCDAVPADQLAPDVLQHVAHLGDEHEEHQQAGVPALVAGNFEHQERRRVADAEHAQHQPEMDFRRALEEPLRVAGGRDARRDEQKCVHGNQEREHAVPLNADQPVSAAA